jgi:hypothetical protein
VADQQVAARPDADDDDCEGGGDEAGTGYDLRFVVFARIIARRLRYAKTYSALSSRSDSEWQLP